MNRKAVGKAIELTNKNDTLISGSMSNFEFEMTLYKFLLTTHTFLHSVVMLPVGQVSSA